MLLSALLFMVVSAGPVPLVAGAPPVAAPIETVHRRHDPVPVPLPPRFRSPISLGISWIGRTIAAVGAVLMAFSFIAGFLALVGAVVVLATQSLGPMSIPVAVLLFGLIGLCVLLFIVGLVLGSVGGALEFVGRMVP